MFVSAGIFRPLARLGLPVAVPLLAMVLVVLGTQPAHSAQPAHPQACTVPADPGWVEGLRNRFEAARASGTLSAGGEALRARVSLPEVYTRREWFPVWVRAGGVSACATELVRFLEAAGEDGLEPDDYHLRPIRVLLARSSGAALSPREAIDLDLLLTDAFLTFGSHLAQGRVNPVTLEAEWLANRRSFDMGQVLTEALETGAVGATLTALRPRQPGYERLRARLAELRALQAAGGWGTIPPGPTLRPGSADPRVPALRARLLAGGDMSDSGEELDETLFDGALEAAVRDFQRRHGLDPDGAVGARTLAALNASVSDRIRRIETNMERWRWLPEDLGSTHIRVNIADFTMEVWEAGSVSFEMRAVVGREYRQTPMFSGSMTYLVLAPYWHVPPGIAQNDKLPELRRNPGYLTEQRMVLLDQQTNAPVDPTAVDFTSLSGAEFNRQYRLRQDPGPWNALGQVKFMFPNRHNVYLHDTPARELFSRTERAFSSGCIRLERPLELADYLLERDSAWTPERIRTAAGRNAETTVRLASPVPVHLLYWTAFVDDAGVVHFRDDIYQRDARVQRALEAEPPDL